VCFGTRGVVLCQSCDVEIVQDASSVFNTGGKENQGVGGEKGYIYLSSLDFFVQLVRYDDFDSYPALCWLKNTKRPSLHRAQPPGTARMRLLETRYSTRGEESLLHQALGLQLKQCSTVRPRASRSTLRLAQVVSTVQASNTATNTPGCGQSTPN